MVKRSEFNFGDALPRCGEPCSLSRFKLAGLVKHDPDGVAASPVSVLGSNRYPQAVRLRFIQMRGSVGLVGPVDVVAAQHEAFIFCRECLGTAGIYDVGFLCSEMMETDTDEAGVRASVGEAPRDTAGFVETASAYIPCFGRRVVAAFCVNEEPVVSQLNRDIVLHSPCFETSSEVADEGRICLLPRFGRRTTQVVACFVWAFSASGESFGSASGLPRMKLRQQVVRERAYYDVGTKFPLG